MFDFLLTDEQNAAARRGARPRALGAAPDDPGHGPRTRSRSRRSSCAEAGRRDLLGCRYPRRWGGRGHGLGRRPAW